jgi:maltooligosyltrehalose trehalohydrolase
MTNWHPRLGATVLPRGTAFRVWAPDASLVSVVREGHDDAPMEKSPEGYFSATLSDCHPGDLYRFSVDGMGPFPDPASRYQPQGVHGPSQVIDPSAFVWRDGHWKGVVREDLILYELHTGTFTQEGTFQSAASKLANLRDLGITAVELMPVADFAGDRNWGYDGVALFAPARCYGIPDDLRRFVDTAHKLGLAILLDVVYNHFGPDGAYHSLFSRHYFSQKHHSPWGEGINFDGANSGPVRDFFIENALRWIHEYHFDGLRLDATHAIVDEGPQHILASLASAAKNAQEETGRSVHIIAEDVGNLAYMLEPENKQGWGLDAIWSDDFHHQVRRALAGDSDGYFRDFDGSTRSIVETAKKGWFYCGQCAPFFGKERGSDPHGLDYSHFVFFLQNHDQIGNRAFGDRLHHKIDLPVYRAAVALLLVLPQIPLLFMGQEWAASTPFLYFTDHHPELGRMVTEGRRREFDRFSAFADPHTRESIPDPQAAATLEASRLVWEETAREPHASVLRLYKALLALRKSEPALRSGGRSGELLMDACGKDTLIVKREKSDGQTVLAIIQLKGEKTVDLRPYTRSDAALGGAWQILLNTEDPLFAADAIRSRIELSSSTIQFSRPGAVLLRALKGNEI